MEAAPSNTRLKLDWRLSYAPPNGELSDTGMRDCEIQDEELPPALSLFQMLSASLSIEGFSSPRLQHDPS